MRWGLDEYAAHLDNLNRITPAVAKALEAANTVRSNYSTCFYIAGALTGVQEEVKERYVALSELAAASQDRSIFGYAPHLHGTDPVKHPRVTPAEVRDIDFLWAGVMPQFHFNLMDPVAHGNAIEAAWAEMYDIPSYYLAPVGLRLSRLILGLRNLVEVIRYEKFSDDGLVQAQQIVNRIAATHQG
jgi:hypothetical protein